MAPQEGSAFWAPFATGTWGSRPRRARKCARPGTWPAVPQPQSPRAPDREPGVRQTGKRRGWRSRARAPPLGQEARVRPGPQLTPGPAEGVEGVQAREGGRALPRTAWAAGLSGTHAAGTWTWGAFPGGAGPRRCLEAASGRQVEPILPRGNSSARRGPEARAHRAPTRGGGQARFFTSNNPALPRGRKGHREAKLPLRGHTAGEGGWTWRLGKAGGRGVASRCPCTEGGEEGPGGPAGFFPGREGRGPGWAE